MYLDIVMGIILLFAFLDGWRNGIFVEFLVIMGIGINILLAKHSVLPVMNILNIHNKDNIFIYLLVFIVLYVVIGIIINRIKNMLINSDKSLVNKFFGGVIGLIKGLAIVGVIIFILDMKIADTEIFSGLNKYKKDSYSRKYFYQITPNLEKFFPSSIQKKLNKINREYSFEKIVGEIL